MMETNTLTRVKRDPALLRLIAPYPIRCAACGGANAEEHVLCGECLALLAKEPPINRFADVELFADSAAAHMYYDQSAAMVTEFKYGGTRALVSDMAGDMLSALSSIPGRAFDLVTYVPMPRRRAKRRLYDQARVLAEAVSPDVGAPCEKLLARTRECRQQALIDSPSERALNVLGAFRALRPLGGETVLLIDDVHTTGATARECAKELLNAGAGGVTLLTYAVAHLN